MPEEAPVISAVVRNVSVMSAPWVRLRDKMTNVIPLLIDGDRHICGQGCDCLKDSLMRVTREKAAENRENIVAVASRLFRENGFDGIGLDAIMQAAGLTHGGFYRHFDS